jgi:uncharacterized protein (DUF58 family)
MSALESWHPRRLRRRGNQVLLEVRSALSHRTERPREFARPVTDVVSGAGWLVALCCVAAALGAVLLGWGELVVVAWLLAFVLLGSVAFILGSHQLTSRLDLSRDRVVVGEKATGRLLLTNGSRRRTLPMTVELPVGIGRADFDLPSLPGGDEHEELFRIPTARRAVLTLGPVRTVRADPFFLLERKQNLDEPQTLHVHPRTVPVEGSSAGVGNDLEGITTRKLSDSDVSFHALRAYVPGDDRRYVHWKSTARTGTMMVRQFEETRRSHLLVLLSSRIDDYLSEDEFELAVSVAGSLGLQTLRDGQGLSVRTSTRDLAARTNRALLDDLSGVDYEAQALRLPHFARRAAQEVPEASVVVVVCGSLAQAAETRAAVRKFPIDVRTIVVRAEPESESSLSRIADVDVANIGHLEDLGPLARRLSR